MKWGRWMIHKTIFDQIRENKERKRKEWRGNRFVWWKYSEKLPIVIFDILPFSILLCRICYWISVCCLLFFYVFFFLIWWYQSSSALMLAPQNRHSLWLLYVQMEMPFYTGWRDRSNYFCIYKCINVFAILTTVCTPIAARLRKINL